MNHGRSLGCRPFEAGFCRHVVLALLTAFLAVPERAGALELAYVSNPAAKRVDRFAMDGSSLGSIDVKDYEPFGLAVNSFGDVWVSDAAGGVVYAYDSKGEVKGSIDTGLRQQYFLATDGADRLFVSNHGAEAATGSVAVFDKDGKPVFEITENIDRPYGIAFDRSGFLYVANNGSNRITRYDSDGKFVDGFDLERDTNPVGLAITRDGKLFVSNPDVSQVYAYDLSGTYLSTLKDSLSSPIGLATDGDGNLYAVNKSSDSVSKFDTDGKNDAGFAPTGLSSPYGIAIGVPEPSTYVLGGVGMSVSAMAVRRRNRGRGGRERGKFGVVR